MSNYLSDVTLIISVGTLLLLVGFIILFIFLYKNRNKAHQQQLAALQEIYQRELLQSQIEIQNHTLQQIAQELHDNVGQLLTVVVMRLNSLEDEIVQPATLQSVQQTRDLVRTVMTDIRSLSKTLDYNTVQRFGLLPSLVLELERINRTGQIWTQLVTSGEPYPLGEQTEIVLLRIAQESLNNVLKHANARNLTVSTEYNSDNFTLTVVDDGKGFNVDEASARKLKNAGAGLYNLDRRASLLGGTCSVISQPGDGTRIEIRIPRSQSA